MSFNGAVEEGLGLLCKGKRERSLSKDLAGQSAKILEYPLHVTGMVVFDDRLVPDINLFDPSRP